MRETIQSGRYPVRPGMCWGVKQGGQLFLSGTAPLDADRKLIGEGDPEAQARACFDDIIALLALAGLDLSSVTKLTCYATNKAAALAYIKVKAALFPTNPPACTTVIVSALLIEGMQLEVDATAVAG